LGVPDPRVADPEAVVTDSGPVAFVTGWPDAAQNRQARIAGMVGAVTPRRRGASDAGYGRPDGDV